jgi:hypothetical protein
MNGEIGRELFVSRHVVKPSSRPSGLDAARLRGRDASGQELAELIDAV